MLDRRGRRLLLFRCSAPKPLAAAEKVLFDFENQADLNAWSQFLPDDPKIILYAPHEGELPYVDNIRVLDGSDPDRHAPARRARVHGREGMVVIYEPK